MKLSEIRTQLTALLEEAAAKARRDARGTGTDLSDILGGESTQDIEVLDETSVREAIEVINRATRTKAGARKLVAAIAIAVKYAGKAL